MSLMQSDRDLLGQVVYVVPPADLRMFGLLRYPFISCPRAASLEGLWREVGSPRSLLRVSVAEGSEFQENRG